jgi:hypothetical protein
MVRSTSVKAIKSSRRLGILALVLGLCVGACTSLPDAPSPESGPGAAPSVAPEAPSERGAPGGTLLLLGDNGPFVIDAGGDGPVELPGDLAGLELSPDGNGVLAARFVREPTGITRHVELVTVAIHSGEMETIGAAAPREDVAPAVWSPDGTQVAYRSTTYERDPSRTSSRSRSGRRRATCLPTRRSPAGSARTRSVSTPTYDCCMRARDGSVSFEHFAATRSCTDSNGIRLGARSRPFSTTPVTNGSRSSIYTTGVGRGCDFGTR